MYKLLLPIDLSLKLVCFYFHTYVHFQFKHASLGTHLGYLNCLGQWFSICGTCTPGGMRVVPREHNSVMVDAKSKNNISHRRPLKGL